MKMVMAISHRRCFGGQGAHPGRFCNPALKSAGGFFAVAECNGLRRVMNATRDQVRNHPGEMSRLH